MTKPLELINQDIPTDDLVRDQSGAPLVVYRGEHGDNDGPESFHTRLGSISFGSYEAAKLYALEPNNCSDEPVNPRIHAVYLVIRNPVMVNLDDPFIDLSLLIEKVGEEEATRLALKFAEHIRNTGNWDENYHEKFDSVADLLQQKPEELGSLYFNAYPLFDDHEEVARFKALGFDGAIHVGNGETAGEDEYKIFDARQAIPAAGIEYLKNADERTLVTTRKGLRP